MLMVLWYRRYEHDENTMSGEHGIGEGEDAYGDDGSGGTWKLETKTAQPQSGTLNTLNPSATRTVAPRIGASCAARTGWEISLPGEVTTS